MNKTVIHTLTGLFVLAALLIAGLSILSRSTIQNFFRTVHRCEAWMPEALVEKGDPVEFRGFTVGRVASVNFVPWNTEQGNAWFRVHFDIDVAWAEAITDEFTLTVSPGPLGALTGTSLVLLAPGEKETLDRDHVAERRGQPLASYDKHSPVRLTYVEARSFLDGVTDQAEQLLRQLEPQAKQVVAKLGEVADELARPDGDLFTFTRLMRRTAENLQKPIDDATDLLIEVRSLVETINDPEGSVQRMLAHAEAVAQAIEAGEGVVGGLLREGEIKEQTVELMERTTDVLTETKELMARTKATLGDVNQSSEQFPLILAEVRQLMVDVRTILSRVDSASLALPGLAEDLRRALSQANETLAGVRESAFLGLFADFESPPPGSPLTLPAAAGGAR